MKDKVLYADDASVLRVNFSPKNQYEVNDCSRSPQAWQYTEKQFGSIHSLEELIDPSINPADLYPYVDKTDSEVREVAKSKYDSHGINRQVLGMARGAKAKLIDEINDLSTRLKDFNNDINEVDKYRVLRSRESVLKPNWFHISQFVVFIFIASGLFLLEWCVQALFLQRTGNPEFIGTTGFFNSLASTSAGLAGSLGLKHGFDFHRKTPKRVASISLTLSLFLYFALASFYYGASTMIDEKMMLINGFIYIGMMFFQMLVNMFAFVLIYTFVQKMATYFKHEEVHYSKEYAFLQAEISSLEAQRRNKNIRISYLEELEMGYDFKKKNFENSFLLAVEELRVKQSAFVLHAKSHYARTYYADNKLIDRD